MVCPNTKNYTQNTCHSLYDFDLPYPICNIGHSIYCSYIMWHITNKTKLIPKWCMATIAIVSLHQVLQKLIGIKIPIIDSYLDAALFMPICLTLFRWERRLLKKDPKYNFSSLAVCVIVTLLSIVTELIFPKFQPLFIGDIWDVALYFVTSYIWFLCVTYQPNAKAS